MWPGSGCTAPAGRSASRPRARKRPSRRRPRPGAAAELLHLHHSSVSRRIDQIGRAMGIDLTDPTGLFRARLALATWRLLGD
ncbi:helix-turn-helix domain-containing protein [Nocardia vinacea]|uniref:helix-turn-helix domain-containing protein n=1 Tax=Nocardia vinacea TaxID=96468 RepID=UPI003AF3C86C